MTSIEDQVRATLHDMADEARPAPLLQRLERESARSFSGPASAVLAGAAAVLAIAIAAASLIWVRADRGSIVEPAVDPPKVFRLSGEESAAPGRGAMLVVLADTSAKVYEHDKPAYLLPVRGGPAVFVEESDRVATRTEHLSQDGTRVVRQTGAVRGSANPVGGSRLEIVDVRTGAVDDVHGVDGACPSLSPDNSAVAAYGTAGTRIIDVASGGLTVVNPHRPETGPASCSSLAWSPDGSRLLVPAPGASALVDREGRTLARIPGRRAVNASMSWSPDGRWVLLYDMAHGRYVSRQVDEADDTVLTVPGDAIKPVGWAGSRIVWLAGAVGAEQRLITTDERGRDPRLWTRLETRGMAVEVVSWSTPLLGAGRG